MTELVFDFRNSNTENRVVYVYDEGVTHVWKFQKLFAPLLNDVGLRLGTDVEIDISGTHRRAYRVVFTTDEAYFLAKMAFAE